MCEDAPEPGLTIDQKLHVCDMAQRQYENELNLFSTRMSLFLVVNSGLLAATGFIRGEEPVVDSAVVAAAGFALSTIWFAVAFTADRWVYTWRLQWCRAWDSVPVDRRLTSVFTVKAWARFSPARPTAWTLLLPLGFAVAWGWIFQSAP